MSVAINANCHTVTPHGESQGIQLQKDGTIVAVFLGSKERRGVERYLFVDREVSVMDGTIFHATIVPARSGASKFAAPTASKTLVVLVKTGDKCLISSKFKQDVTIIAGDATRVDYGTLRTRDGEVASREAIWTLSPGTTIEVAFASGEVKRLANKKGKLVSTVVRSVEDARREISPMAGAALASACTALADKFNAHTQKVA